MASVTHGRRQMLLPISVSVTMEQCCHGNQLLLRVLTPKARINGKATVSLIPILHSTTGMKLECV